MFAALHILLKILFAIYMALFFITTNLVMAVAIGTFIYDVQPETRRFWINTALACLGGLIACLGIVLTVWRPRKAE